MDEQPRIVAMYAWQCAQKVPTSIDLIAAAVGALELVAGPKDGSLGAAVESFGIKHRALIVVAQKADLGFVDHQVETLARVRTVANDIAQAINLVYLLVSNMRKHRLKRFEVAMNVADDRAFHLDV